MQGDVHKFQTLPRYTRTLDLHTGSGPSVFELSVSAAPLAWSACCTHARNKPLKYPAKHPPYHGTQTAPPRGFFFMSAYVRGAHESSIVRWGHGRVQGSGSRNCCAHGIADTADHNLIDVVAGLGIKLRRARPGRAWACARSCASRLASSPRVPSTLARGFRPRHSTLVKMCKNPCVSASERGGQTRRLMPPEPRLHRS